MNVNGFNTAMAVYLVSIPGILVIIYAVYLWYQRMEKKLDERFEEERRIRYNKYLREAFKQYCADLRECDEKLFKDHTTTSRYTELLIARFLSETRNHDILVSSVSMKETFVSGYILAALTKALRKVREHVKPEQYHEIYQIFVKVMATSLRLYQQDDREHSIENKKKYVEKSLDLFLSPDMKRFYAYKGSLDYYNSGLENGAPQIKRKDLSEMFQSHVLSQLKSKRRRKRR